MTWITNDILIVAVFAGVISILVIDQSRLLARTVPSDAATEIKLAVFRTGMCLAMLMVLSGMLLRQQIRKERENAIQIESRELRTPPDHRHHDGN